MESLSPTDVAAITATATALVTSTMQWVKQFAWWKNSWCRLASPLVGLIGTLGWLVAYGGLTLSTVQPMMFYQLVIAGFCAGVGAIAAYEAQRPLHLLPPGPNNHPADREESA